MRAVIGGLIGGAIGALAWAGVVVFTGYEVGWIAWGVGGLVGYGVAKGNEDGARSSTAAGTLAVVIAALAIVAGKYAGIQSVMPSDDEIMAMFTANFESEEYLISYVADEVVAEYVAAGLGVDWPAGVDPSQAAYEVDYPADVWAEADARWAARSEQERTDFRAAREAETMASVSESMPEIRAALVGGGFAGSFTPMDLIFFGLAMVTAFGVGSGAGKTADELAEEYAEAVQLAMIRVMIADGHADEREVRTVCEIYEQVTGKQVSEQVIAAKATLAQSQGRDLEGELRELTPYLADEAKAGALKAAVAVAAADGAFGSTEKELLARIADALGLDESRLRAMVTQPA